MFIGDFSAAMCGDGANDCGALKAAHTGISLSEAESSVASPFTSNDPDISCVPKVIREGRAALVTSFGVFKFMVAYSLTEFLSVIILYGIDANLTNLQFLFIDICLVVNFASFFGNTEAYRGKLVAQPPMTSLLGFTPLFSLAIFMLTTIFFQYFAYYFIQTFSWFTPFVYNGAKPMYFTSFENYAVFSTSLFQYITMAIVFSQGKPYRMPIFTNFSFFSSIILMIAINSYIVIYPPEWVINVLELKLPPEMNPRLAIILLSFVNFLACLFFETFLVEFVVHKKIRPLFHNLEKSRKKYLKIFKEIRRENWPGGSRESCVSFVNEKRDCSAENVITKL